MFSVFSGDIQLFANSQKNGARGSDVNVVFLLLGEVSGGVSIIRTTLFSLIWRHYN